MKRAPLYLFLTLVLVGVIALVERQRTLDNIGESNAMLSMQIAASRPDSPATPSTNTPLLSASEKRELLQLRSRIGRLREEVKLASNQVSLLQKVAAVANRKSP